MSYGRGIFGSGKSGGSTYRSRTYDSGPPSLAQLRKEHVQ